MRGKTAGQEGRGGRGREGSFLLLLDRRQAKILNDFFQKVTSFPLRNTNPSHV